MPTLYATAPILIASLVLALALGRGPRRPRSIRALALLVALASNPILILAVVSADGSLHLEQEVAAASIAWSGTLQGLVLTTTSRWVFRSFSSQSLASSGAIQRTVVAAIGTGIGAALLMSILAVGRWMTVGLAGLAPHRYAIELAIATGFVIFHECCHLHVGRVCRSVQRLIDAAVNLFAVWCRADHGRMRGSMARLWTAFHQFVARLRQLGRLKF